LRKQVNRGQGSSSNSIEKVKVDVDADADADAKDLGPTSSPTKDSRLRRREIVESVIVLS
jgi:hypothetical protein